MKVSGTPQSANASYSAAQHGAQHSALTSHWLHTDQFHTVTGVNMGVNVNVNSAKHLTKQPQHIIYTQPTMHVPFQDTLYPKQWSRAPQPPSWASGGRYDPPWACPKPATTRGGVVTEPYDHVSRYDPRYTRGRSGSVYQ